MPKRYLSHSEIYLWQRDRTEYVNRYVRGEAFEPNRRMLLGTIIHKAAENPDYLWLKELKDNRFRTKKQLNVRKILTQLSGERGNEHEKVMIAKTPEGHGIMSIFDSFRMTDRRLWEYKTSDNKDRWNQWIVDNDDQITIYQYVFWLVHHQFFSQIDLLFCNTVTGTVKKFSTVRSRRDIAYMDKKVRAIVAEMKAAGVWDKRLSRAERDKMVSMDKLI